MNKAAASLARKYYRRGVKAAEIKRRLDEKQEYVSISSIYNWIKEGNASGEHGNLGRPAVLATLTKQVFLHAAFISRYDFKRLKLVIEPFIEVLQKVEGANEQVSDKTLRRFFDCCISQNEIPTPLRTPPAPGTVVLHGIPIRWQQTEAGKLNRGVLLCIFERHTAFTYLRAYTQIKFNSLYRRINIFSEKYQAHIRKILLTTRKINSDKESKLISTIIRGPYDELYQHLEDEIDKDGKNIALAVTKPLVGKLTSIQIPGSFSGIDKLNRLLEKISDNFNKTQRLPQMDVLRGNAENYCPRARLWKLVDKEYKDFHKRDTFVERSRFSAK